MNYKEIEVDLDKLKRLRFNKANKPKTLQECVNMACNGAATYTATTGSSQCGMWRSRGIADIYRICKHYFPKCTLKDVVSITKNKGHKDCCTTNQTVFYGSKGVYEGPKGISIRVNRKKVYINELT